MEKQKGLVRALLFTGLIVLLVSFAWAEQKEREEPTVTKEEAALLEEVIEIAQKDPAKAIELLTEKITHQSSAALDFALGSLKLQQGKVKEAEKSYRSALRKMPSFTRARAHLARSLIMQEKLAEATQLLQSALLEGKPTLQTLTLLGYAFLLQGQPVLSREVRLTL